MTGWLKAVHIIALASWCGGLVVLPSLLRRRQLMHEEQALFRLQRLVRSLFVLVMSPAAFIAVTAGTALIFVREVFTAWMALKLLGVGVLVGLHIRLGYVLLNLFEPGARFAPWRQWLASSTAVVTISAVLVLVLGKPMIDLDALPAWLRQPGGLQSFSETIMPMP